MKRKSKLTIAKATAVLAVLGGTAVYAQDKYSLKSPSGIAFSDFRGYEDWAVVSSARTDEVLKVIVADPTMIDAYKAGIPGNGQPFPDGSRIVKLQWKPKKSTEAPFVVDVPDVFTQAFVIEKDSERFPKSGGWGYALFNYEAASDSVVNGDGTPAIASATLTGAGVQYCDDFYGRITSIAGDVLRLDTYASNAFPLPARTAARPWTATIRIPR